MATHSAITLQRPSAAPRLPVKSDANDERRESNAVPSGGPMILAMENRPCSRPMIAPRSSGDTAPVVSVVRDVACICAESDMATDATVVATIPSLVIVSSPSGDENMIPVTTVPNATIDTSLQAIPANANRSDRFPASAMAGEIPTAAKAATDSDEALMKYPSWDVENLSLFARMRGVTVDNAEDDTPLKSFTSNNGPIVG